ncbi:hypothetical protein PFICI_11192 [Pestalotiopsis fici W106-1]|uniref:TeaA receptor TeaR n=1 Tax=Pestalotiopsis fici (strain W106-1 / CGMCC3.15140) TaxID=1229662 RepID=W3WTW9_PESFW|nr:uncharacterized protein PFICI_11192 [Pestalotiopsis fici W106-1]ETS77318.1 hypothetical protein PFICI_11192 [Pestalotiopsis fici W106-1]
MAAMSSAAPGATTLTPPSSSHGNEPVWKSSYTSGYDQDSMQDRNFASGYETTNGAVHDDYDDIDPFARQDPGEPFPATKVRNGGRSTSRPDNKRGQSHNSDPGPTEDSRWIHRDKLAKIENAELQAAGIVLPKPRSQSRPRRERSTEKLGGRRPTDASEHQPLPRSRKNSTQASISGDRHPEMDNPAWDLRLPQEIAESPDEYWISSDTLAGKGSRIPVARQSPGTFPIDSNDRNGTGARKTGGSVSPDDDFSLAVSKPRSRSGSTTLNATTGNHQPKRSATDNSPKKTPSTGTRKPSAATAKSTATTRPKTRSGSGKDSGNAARPTTRSGELSPKAPEGDPPWMISAYKPDPRLPPDQQLLPTVAKRLQQEKWEKEGKFGNVYDKEFRPLNDEGFSEPPPELPKPPVEDKQDEWPLRADAKSPTLSRPGTSSYSTMPRIQDTPVTPMASPRLPSAPPQPQPQPIQVTRVPTAPEEPEPQQPSEKEKKKEAGCGCCVVM